MEVEPQMETEKKQLQQLRRKRKRGSLDNAVDQEHAGADADADAESRHHFHGGAESVSVSSLRVTTTTAAASRYPRRMRNSPKDIMKISASTALQEDRDRDKDGSRGKRRNNSPTSTAKPSTETSPARKRSRRNSRRSSTSATSMQQYNHLNKRSPAKKRGRGRPRRYSRPEDNTLTSTSSYVPKSKAKSKPNLAAAASRTPRRREKTEPIHHVEPTPTRKSTRTPRKRSFDIQHYSTTSLEGRGSSNTVTSNKSISNPQASSSIIPTNIDTTTAITTTTKSPNGRPNWKENWRQAILLELQRKVRIQTDKYAFFSKPVDPIRDECEDYYDIIRPEDAMCFDVIQEKIISEECATIEDYVILFTQIRTNAIKYNSDDDNFVRKQAELMEKRAESSIRFARDRWGERLEKERLLEEKRAKEEELELQRRRMQERRRRMALAVEEEEETTTTMPRGGSNRSRSPRNRRGRGRSRGDNSYQEVDNDYDDKDDKDVYNSEDDVDENDSGGSNYEVKSRRASSRRSRSRSRSRSQRHSQNSSRRRSQHASPALLEGEDSDGRETRRLTTRSGRVTNSKVYNDDEDSLGFLSESDLLPQNDDDDDDDLECGPIEGSDIPFCKPMLAGSVMTPCNTRKEWLELCPKLATVCNEAARRSTLRKNAKAKRYEKPLSEIYIRERMEYDEPLEGFVVRTKGEPNHVQGFIIATQFTTWRRTFRFATDSPAALVTPTDHRLYLTDRDCELTKELQQAVRVGPDAAQGYKYPRICEISLLGGLGCGGALISRSLSELRQAQKYDYVVLQSTKIAIPFYEKHGFVRIGAVTRFNDNESLPEVAYRHWSEIVNGEAVEASYMMARRLKTSRGDTLTDVSRTKVQEVTEDERKQEIVEALKASYSLLSDALTIRIGSAAYTNSFREVLSAAREYALSADDFHLVKVIDKAQSEFTGSHFGRSKRILRSVLRNGRSNVGNENRKGEEGDGKGLRHDADEELSAAEDEEVTKSSNVAVTVVLEGDDSEPADAICASLPIDFLSKDDFFKVKVVVDGEVFESDSEGEEPISLIARLDRAHKSSCDIIEACSLALENLMSSLKRSITNGMVDHCGVGDDIMIKVELADGSPLWVNATVKKRCKMNSAPYYSGSNGFSVEWEELDVLNNEARVLDVRNRGVGKSWCTAMDWASFSVLPLEVLDSLLIGSKIRYPNGNGETVEGMVTKRVGGGLDKEARFKIDIGRKSMKGKISGGTEVYRHEFLAAGALREAIHVTDSNCAQTRKLLKSLQKPEPKPTEIKPVNKVPKHNKKLTILTAGAWAAYRLKEFNLAQISENEKIIQKKRCNKIDDQIIHLSTGIGAKTNEIASVAVREASDVGQTEQNTPQSTSLIEPSENRRKRKAPSSDKEDEIETSSTVAEEKKEDQQVAKRSRLDTTTSNNESAILRRSTRTRVTILQN